MYSELSKCFFNTLYQVHKDSLVQTIALFILWEFHAIFWCLLCGIRYSFQGRTELCKKVIFFPGRFLPLCLVFHLFCTMKILSWNLKKRPNSLIISLLSNALSWKRSVESIQFLLKNVQITFNSWNFNKWCLQHN